MSPTPDKNGPSVPVPVTFQKNIYPAVLSHLPKQEGLRVLDAGAGEGYFCSMLREHGYAVDACEFNTEQFVLQDIKCSQADLNVALPYPNATFDCVTSIEVIEHLYCHHNFMAELVRVTKPGGLIVITTPNVLNMTNRLRVLFYGETDVQPYPLNPEVAGYHQHVNPIDVPRIMFYLNAFGAKLEKVATNRYRKGSVALAVLFYPACALLLSLHLFRKKPQQRKREHYQRYLRSMLSLANMAGRITIAIGRKNL